MFKLFSIKSLFKDGSLTKDTITTTVWSTIGKSIGFIIPFFLARWFSISSETDAFFFAYGLVLFLYEVFALAMESVIVPYIANFEQGNKDVGKFIGKVLLISSGGLSILILVLTPVIKPLISLITNFNLMTRNLAYVLFLEMTVLIIIVAWNSILAGSINAYKKFMFPALSPGVRALIILITIFSLKSILGVHAIAIGYVTGELIRTLILIIVVYKMKLFHLSFSFRMDSNVKDFFKISFFQILGFMAVSLNPFADKVMASWLEEGSVSVLYYADRLFMVPITFMVAGLMVTLLSHWSWRFSRKDYKRKIHKDVSKAIKIVLFICIPIMLVLVVFSRQIVNVVYGKGSDISIKALSDINITWLLYLVGFIPAMIGRVFGRAHLSLKNTIILMKGGFLSFALNILLNLVLMRFLGIAGIALSTSVVFMVTLFYYRWAFYKKLKEM